MDQQILLEQPVNLLDSVAATKSNCIDCEATNSQFSPLFVSASSALEPGVGATKAPFASLVERNKFLW